MNLKVSEKAQKDLINIWEYTFQKWSLEQADKYFNILVHGMNEICKNPDLGKSYEYIRKDYFGYNQKSHIIFYRIINNETIEIIRILHQKMDLHNRIIGY
ncbi:MAG: type II toxin-antitoxin system RelE/ParE family toxin [Saprospiraceae bacterium]|jgi:toxin ParE1/3/4|nr:type II toxin-antitoxin system RelE/ParE family toxin [Candidatus Defluviibacterium haderslevense]MCC7028567.1 type II toxin-antitoxin system RelE/ParE family toxin [Saprospiraceae bacterium]MCI1266788.1 type II toxin-antitoxin system RelE/ParE family toxin [Saprospiraceae bacterium]